MAKNTLKPLVKTYIVVRLAFRVSPSRIVEKVKDVFNVTITRQGVNAYNPEKKAAKNLSPELKFLFESMRELYDFEATLKKQEPSKKKIITETYVFRGYKG